MYKCEVCGKIADKHHIVYRSQGGVDFPLNFKYLCSEHHRGTLGPHKNRKLDLEYKLKLQENLNKLLNKNYYGIDELSELVQINRGMMRKLLEGLKFYKEGYEKSEVIYRLMGRKEYEENMKIEYSDFTSN